MISRRDWLGTSAALAAGAILPGFALGEANGATPILRAIPASGEKLPVIGLGTNNYSPTSVEERLTRRVVLDKLPQLGGKVVDTAPAYRD